MIRAGELAMRHLISAIGALGESALPDVDLLLSFLDARVANVREAAVCALQAYAARTLDQRVLGRINQLLEADPNEDVRAVAEKVLLTLHDDGVS